MAEVMTKRKRTTRKPAKEPASATPAPPIEHEPGDEPPAQDPAQQDARPSPKIGKALTFFQQCTRVAKADWGTRAKITVYRLEPIIDRLRGSNTKYIMVYNEPVSEEKIKIDHGSGRYRLILTYYKPAANKGDEIDMIEFDILDEKFPPRIPKGEWVDDPRNAKWAWAKEIYDKAQPQQATAANGSLMDGMRLAGEIRREVREEMRPADQTTEGQRLVSMLDVAERIADAKKPAPQDNTVLTIITGQIDALRVELADSRKRNDALMDKLIDARTAPKENSNGLGNIKEIFTAVKEFLPTVQELWPTAKEAVTGHNRKWWQELVTEGLPVVGDVLRPFATVAAQLIMHNATKGAAPPANGAQPHAPSIAAPQQGNPPPQSQNDLTTFLQGTVVPAMLNKLPLNAPGEELGSEFAEWMEDGYGNDRLTQVQGIGTAPTIQYFRTSPLWPAITAICTEQKFEAFIKAFMEWKPEPDNENEGEALTPEVVEV